MVTAQITRLMGDLAITNDPVAHVEKGLQAVNG
jgi:hypothetical protein